MRKLRNWFGRSGTLKLGIRTTDWTETKLRNWGPQVTLSFLSVETACLPCLRIISVSLFEETVMTSYICHTRRSLISLRPIQNPLASMLTFTVRSTVLPERNYTFWPKRKQLYIPRELEDLYWPKPRNIICPPYLQDFHPCFLTSHDWKYLKNIPESSKNKTWMCHMLTTIYIKFTLFGYHK